MDHKEELMNRWRERMAAATDPTLAGWQNPNDPIAQMFARWMIDFVADAQELERSATIDHYNRAIAGEPRKGLLRPIGDGEGLASWDNSSLAEVFAGQDERASVTITAEFIEGLWSGAGPWVTPWVDQPSRHVGKVGRFHMWLFEDKSVWAVVGGTEAVMVVKPDPELSSDSG